ncbi:type I restriction modification DNA specificity protein [Winogradskyella pacifica]|uniref:Type I restriction modification DNA specificity protein n=1 Tax=Winogradskyella pacifica TaxID=664642 RepID=A0A3D9N5A8_9FLAO|nr:restriction endonuclease subunit S [Winogradskyella pacifica]REE27264.1 type I restriction modification DNA specificity protein [Winogradskyella pacifica]
MKLKEITTISSGINERRNPQGTIYYLGASDFVDFHSINPLIEPSLMPSSKLEKHFLTKEDIVVLAKGHNGFIAHTLKHFVKPMVASSVFMVLRDTITSVIPSYIAWYINLESTQKELRGYSRGTALPAINRTILGELDIEIPTLEIQKNIVAIDELKKQESKLTKQLDHLKTTKLELLLKNKIQS